MTKPVPLPNQTYLRERFDYDPQIGILIMKPRPRSWFYSENLYRAWNSRCAGKTTGHIVLLDGAPYLQTGLDGKHVLAHRLIWKWMTGEDPIEIDHENRNGTDNRWDNLRDATSSENKCNRLGGLHGLPKGVAVTRSGKRWYAKIQIGRKQTYLGTFDTLEEASAAYCEAAAKLHGEFAHF